MFSGRDGRDGRDTQNTIAQYIEIVYNPAMKKKIVTSFTLTEEAKDLLKVLSDMMGISRTGVVEIAIRSMAKEKGAYGSTLLNDPPPNKE